MTDELARLLEIIAETFDANADIMAAASKYAGENGRTLVSDHAEGSRDAFMVAAEFVREIAVAPAQSRGQIAARLVLLEDVGESVRGHQLQEARR